MRRIVFSDQEELIGGWMRRIVVTLPDDVLGDLAQLARHEYRDPREHAAFLIADAVRRGRVADGGETTILPIAAEVRCAGTA